MFLFLNKWYNQTVIDIQEAFMKKQNRLLSLILSLFLLLFTLVPQSALTVKAEGNSEMAVHFIDVGQGNAIVQKILSSGLY